MWRDYEFSGNDIELFKNLIPDYCIEPLKEGSLLGMAVINTDSQIKALVGIVLYRFTKGSIEIEWVASTEDYDLPDYGADMVRLILNKARIHGGIRSVFARFREGDIMSEYFPEDEFRRTPDTDGIYRFALSDVMELNKYSDSGRLKNCISIKDADDMLKHGIIACIAQEKEPVPLGLPVNWDTYEQDLSAIYRGEKGAEGIILIENEDDELVISLLYSNNPVAGLMLLAMAFRTALKKYGDRQKVACPVVTDLSERLVKKIVPGSTEPEVICARATLPVGTGTLEDFIVYHPNRRHAMEIHG